MVRTTHIISALYYNTIVLGLHVNCMVAMECAVADMTSHLMWRVLRYDMCVEISSIILVDCCKQSIPDIDKYWPDLLHAGGNNYIFWSVIVVIL